MKFSSTIQVLTIDDAMVPGTVAPFTPYRRFTARAILLDEVGNVVTVGSLRVYDAKLQDKCKVGTFQATFALIVPDWGKQKGEIIASLTDLVPVPAKPVGAKGG